MSIWISEPVTPIEPAPVSRPAQSLEAMLRTEGRQLGFDQIGIARLDTYDGAASAARLRNFLDQGRHGDMTWMAEHADRRAAPLALWPHARSAVMVGLSYAPDHDPLDILGEPLRGAISVYAQGKDYHEILKPRLKQLAGKLASASGADVKVFVDTAPLMEKPLAARAGIGWQGKHTNLVSRTHGSWLFLGALLTTAMLEPDSAENDHCGSCSRCLDICPTRAFPAPYQLDARRCIAYLTIEHKGQIAREFRSAIGNRIFGCDDCLAVCPWNKFAETAHEQRLAARAETANPPLIELLALDDAAFRSRFAGTPIKRTGRDRFVRNALVAAGNARDSRLIPAVTNLLRDPSPLVRGMAVWAIARLADRSAVAHLRSQHLPGETDHDVRTEWEEYLSP